MNIKYQMKDKYSMKELYDLTQAPDIDKMTNHKDETIDISNYLVYEKDDGKGGNMCVCVISTPQGETVATNSATFIRAFTDILDMAAVAGETIHTVQIMSGVSKSGRNFITCKLIA